MKSRIVPCLCLLTAFQLQAMTLVDEQIYTLKSDGAYRGLSHWEREIKQLIERVDGLVVQLDKQHNPVLLSNVLAELNTTKTTLTKQIANALSAINDNRNISDTDAQLLSFTCYDFLKSLKGIDLQAIELAYQGLLRRNVLNEVVDNPRAKPEQYPILQNMRSAELIALPLCVARVAVYQVKATQIPGFCCGYNVLFNACNMEQSCGYENGYADYQIFTKACMTYLCDKGIDPRAGVIPSTLVPLAEEGVHLRKYCYLSEEEGRICPHVRTFRYRYEVGSTEEEIEGIVAEETRKREQEIFQSLRDHCNKNTNACIHFSCRIDGDINHAILMTLVRNATGRALYIFDNMNVPIEDGSQTMRFIHFICKEFNMSEKDAFTGPDLPECWPSLLREFHQNKS